MKEYSVKDLMVPLSEYATVSVGATLFDAVMELEKAQELFDATKYRHRAVLVIGKKQRVIGKLSQLDVLRALHPKNERVEKFVDIGQFGFSTRLINTLREQLCTSGPILAEAYHTAINTKVEDFMQTTSEGEYVDQSTSLDTAIHQLVSGPHLSLLVTSNDEIVGILRMSDVFAAAFHAIKESEMAG